jgi:hypothetical protein
VKAFKAHEAFFANWKHQMDTFETPDGEKITLLAVPGWFMNIS